MLLAISVRAWGDTRSPIEAARLNSVGIALMNQHLTERALDKREQAHTADPTSAIPLNADAQYYLGSFYLSLGDSDHAVAQFQAALRLNPVHASAEFGLACVATRGKTAEAREHLKRIQHLTPRLRGFLPLSPYFSWSCSRLFWTLVQSSSEMIRSLGASCACHSERGRSSATRLLMAGLFLNLVLFHTLTPT